MFGFNILWSVWALLALGFALIGLSWRRSAGKDIRKMAAMPTTPAASIGRLAPGTLVEVKGNLRCAAPLVAEFSQQPCSYFKAEIIREDVVYERDPSTGSQRQKTQRTTEHSNTQQAPCVIEDASGRVALDLAGATVEGTTTVDTTENGPGMLSPIKYLRKEIILGYDIPVYVLGAVRSDGSIGAPPDGASDGTFLVSSKSEEERAKSLSTDVGTATWMIIISVAVSAALFLVAWYKGPA